MLSHEALTDAQRRSAAFAAAWRDRAAWRAMAGAFDAVAPGDAPAATRAARALLGDDGWVAALLAPLIEALADDPLFEPPLRVQRDGLRTGALLYDGPAATIGATILAADAHARLPAPRNIVVPGRIAVVRWVRGGGARLRLWQAERVDQRFTAAGAAPARSLGSVPLADGTVLRLDGRCRAHLVEGASGDVVTLTATIRAGAAPFAREYARDDGRLLRVATLEDRASRTQMLLTLLRTSGRRDAAQRFDEATRDPAFFLRWSAMREWLAFDVATARPRLAAMAVDDPHPEVAAAARATLAQVGERLACRG